MSLLNTNKLTWFENDGAPLVLGYVYVGQARQDPQVPANQKPVTFTDSQGNEFTAPQPLRTDVDGRVQWNGKPIIASIEGNYSLLLLDSNGKEINGGWIPEIEAGTSGGVDSSVRLYELTLSGLKQVAVSVGDTVGNVGKLLANDGEGSNWRVVSSTGSPADDIDIINFDNGLQGFRIRNFLQPQDNLEGLADNAEARNNLDVYSKSETYSQTEADTAFLEDSAGSVQESNLADQSVTSLKIAAEAVEPQNLKTVEYTLNISVPVGSSSFDTGITVSPNDLPLVVYSDEAGIRCTLAKDGVIPETWRIQTENITAGALTRTLTFVRLVP